MEQIRFEHGVYEGRWRDPTIDLGGNAPEDSAQENHSWLAGTSGELTPAQQVASRILFGIDRVLRMSHGKLSHLFKAVNGGTPGVLEPEEFLEGLVQLGILQKGELALEDILDAMGAIDVGFDGRINFTTLGRAISMTQTVQKQHALDSQRLAQQNQLKIHTTYGESLPVDVVKVDRDSRSLYNFERSFEKFKRQQRELLAQHNEHAH